MGRRKEYATLRDKQRAYEARFQAKHGISWSGMHYRLKNGLPLDAPIRKGGRKPSEVVKTYVGERVRDGKPAECVIVRGYGRPIQCRYACFFQFPNDSYFKCLDFAVAQNWPGWRVKGGGDHRGLRGRTERLKRKERNDHGKEDAALR